VEVGGVYLPALETARRGIVVKNPRREETEANRAQFGVHKGWVDTGLNLVS
jgi:hypothetical protein